jgi:2-hydroxy-6-oxonona-2,4-dienedioate hydrolase
VTRPTFVLVHGIGVSHRYFAPLISALAPHGDVVARDLPGVHSGPHRTPTVDALADEVAGWYEGRACVIGQSFGCQVAAALAERHPERVERLVLIGPTVDGFARSWLRQSGRAVRQVVHEPPELLALGLRDYWRAGPRRYVGACRRSMADRIEDRLPAIAAPTHVIRGSGDRLVSDAWAREVVRLLPDATLTTVEGAGHATHWTHPDVVAPPPGGAGAPADHRSDEAGG